jgi:uncharacterized RDD family membrane protein YckC
MPEINIETSQNVSLELKPADFAERILASIIDVVIMFAYIYLLTIIFGYADLSLNSSYALLTIIYAPLLFYNLILESLFDGQSPGKKVMKIKVVRLDGSQMSLFDHFVRWIFRFVDIMFAGGVGIAIMIINGKGQRLGDIVAKTTVISTKNEESLHRSIFQKVEEDYQIQFSQVHLLKDNDMQIIKDVLEATRNAKSLEQFTAIKKLAEKVKKKILVDTDMPDRKFLLTIVKDYNKMYC